MRSPARGPLVLTASDAVSAAVVRACAAAGVVPEIVRDPEAAVGAWGTASSILIGVDCSAEVARMALPRRSQVHVVAVATPEGEVFRQALACGASDVLELPGAQAQLVDLLTDTADGGVSMGPMIGVVGGAGGVGATTFAAALALTFAEAGDALLIDADPHGGGVDQVLGLDPEAGVRWDALSQAAGRLSARSLREALPRRGNLSVLTWPLERASGLSLPTVRAALSAGQRGYSAVVVDIPRTAGAVTDEVIARCDHVVLVSTVTVPALASCLHVAKRVPLSRSSVLLRGRSGVSSAEVERLLQLVVAHRMTAQRGLEESISLGLGPLRARRGPLARASRRFAVSLGSGAEQ